MTKTFFGATAQKYKTFLMPFTHSYSQLPMSLTFGNKAGLELLKFILWNALQCRTTMQVSSNDNNSFSLLNHSKKVS
jgi:hypothetical protein